jgi:RNA polymerase sigma-70 factor, ECF subfamily
MQERADATALASLPSRDAAILRLHFLDGMSARAIGAVYRAHARTVQKWLALAHKQILATTRELLKERLKLDGDDLESLIELVRSQLAVSLSRVLKRAR